MDDWPDDPELSRSDDDAYRRFVWLLRQAFPAFYPEEMGTALARRRQWALQAVRNGSITGEAADRIRADFNIRDDESDVP